MAECKGTSGPNHPDPKLKKKASGCSTRPGTGIACAGTPSTAGLFQLTKSADACFIDGVVGESLNIGGADVNVYKLLGVHEQCRTIDVTGHGQPITNGDQYGFPAKNAFNTFVTSWRSVQQGDGVISSAFIGYDFGVIKTSDDTRRRYGIDANIRKNISAIAIKQGPNAANRANRARIERSDDGIKWYGVAVVNLPDDDCLNTILFKDSVINRYWRIRPTEFNGGPTDHWIVQAIEMYHNYIATNYNNIQDKIFLENRDREYNKEVITLKGSYDLLDTQSELSRFGIEVPSQSFYMTINFSACVSLVGRPLVIGDVVELPSEAQYSATMERKLKWLEVTDVAWSTEGYTPGWQPTLLRVILQPAYASQETQDIFGDLGESVVDDLGLTKNYGTGDRPEFQDYSDVSQYIQAAALDLVPESGREFTSTVRAWEEEEIDAFQQQAGPAASSLQKIGLNATALYVEDAMPPNNAPFTEGPEYPTTANHGDYHRLTYEGLSKDVPARLYRFSGSKNRWLWLETDKRAEFNPNEPKLQEYLQSDTRRPTTAILVRDKVEQCTPDPEDEN